MQKQATISIALRKVLRMICTLRNAQLHGWPEEIARAPTSLCLTEFFQWPLAFPDSLPWLQNSLVWNPCLLPFKTQAERITNVHQFQAEIILFYFQVHCTLYILEQAIPNLFD